VGSPTDIPPAGHLEPKPAHERTADEGSGAADWEKIAARKDFRGLLQLKARLVVPATIFFTVYCLALPVLVGYMRPFMETRVGPVNLAYLFALSQFFVAWIIVAFYVRATNIFDKDATEILDNSGNS
jgi:uncharacterized membrane protein (DUF485 family)